MLGYWWSSLCEAGPTSLQHCISVLYLLALIDTMFDDTLSIGLEPRDVCPLLIQCLFNVYDAGPTWRQHWLNLMLSGYPSRSVSRYLWGYYFIVRFIVLRLCYGTVWYPKEFARAGLSTLTPSLKSRCKCDVPHRHPTYVGALDFELWPCFVFANFIF